MRTSTGIFVLAVIFTTAGCTEDGETIRLPTSPGSGLEWKITPLSNPLPTYALAARVAVVDRRALVLHQRGDPYASQLVATTGATGEEWVVHDSTTNNAAGALSVASRGGRVCASYIPGNRAYSSANVDADFIGDLHVSCFENDVWTESVPLTDVPRGYVNTRIQIDSMGRWIVAYEGADYDLRLLREGSGEPEIVAAHPGEFDFVLDASDQGHVTFMNNEGVHYATPHGAIWDVETVVVNESSGSMGYNPVIALDPAGHVYITYYQIIDTDEGGRIRGGYQLVTNRSSWWIRWLLSDVPGEGLNSQMIVDDAGTIHLVYESEKPGTAYPRTSYMRIHEYAGEVFTVFPDHGPTYNGLGMALDDDGLPHVVAESVLFSSGWQTVYGAPTATGLSR